MLAAVAGEEGEERPALTPPIAGKSGKERVALELARRIFKYSVVATFTIFSRVGTLSPYLKLTYLPYI